MDIKNKLHKMEEILERQGISYYQDITTRSAVRKNWTDIQERYRTYLSEVGDFFHKIQHSYLPLVFFRRSPLFRTIISYNA